MYTNSLYVCIINWLYNFCIVLKILKKSYEISVFLSESSISFYHNLKEITFDYFVY